jgi:glycosyltransferase involved in cell wall biosynthesis
MAEADMLLVPSVRSSRGWQEAFCRVAVEGLGSGLCVIASDCGGLPETVGRGGILVPQGNADALARAIQDAWSGSTPGAWRARALTRARQFEQRLMDEDYDRLTEEALGGG